jgi:hypothetical protein
MASGSAEFSCETGSAATSAFNNLSRAASAVSRASLFWKKQFLYLQIKYFNNEKGFYFI